VIKIEAGASEGHPRRDGSRRGCGDVAVLDVEPGQTVLPGQVLVVVADLQH
jgi:hypothetical protein